MVQYKMLVDLTIDIALHQRTLVAAAAAAAAASVNNAMMKGFE